MSETKMRAMILAAGLGTRLRPITYEVPKPMVPVLNRPVMEQIARLLARHGFSDVVANLHWFPGRITEHFGDGSQLGLNLNYSQEPSLLGTAGGVRQAADFLGESFLVISGDALTDIDLTAMREFHNSHEGIATLVTKRVVDTTQFGVALTDSEGRIQGFQEKPEPAEALSDLANAGIYMFDSEIFGFFPDPGASAAAGPDDADGFADWAMDVFPALLENDVPFYSYETAGYWNDIGTLEELRQGNFDALTGQVDLDRGLPEQEPEIWSAAALGSYEGCEIEGPVMIGDAVTIGEGCRIQGPVIIGDGCEIGPGARVRDSILFPGATVPPASVMIGAIAGPAEPAQVAART